MTCKECQMACYDLIDGSLSEKAQQEVMTHLEKCPDCRSFQEEEMERQRSWPRLLRASVRDVTLPPDTAERVAHALEISNGTKKRAFSAYRREAKIRQFTSWRSLAASLLVLLSGAILFYSARITTNQDSAEFPSDDSFVVLNRNAAAKLNISPEMPGMLSLTSGEATIRLISGVTLNIVGPTELDVQNGMLVQLYSGRILADVPRRATGFTVRTSRLEAQDLGTIFSVSSINGLSDVFVFKGEVRIQDVNQEIISHCHAGEGVLSITEDRLVNVTAENRDARRLFASMRGKAALKQPAGAFEMVSGIKDLWITSEGSKNILSQSDTIIEKQEALSMNTKNAAAVLAAAASITLGVETVWSVSTPVKVNTAPTENRLWETIYTNDVNLAWHWPDDAASVSLMISGMEGTVLTTNFAAGVSSYQWQVFPTDKPAEENIYDLILTFYDDSSMVLDIQSSRLAAVAGAFGGISVDTGPSNSKWSKVRGNVVLPYDAAWKETTTYATSAQLVIDKQDGSVQSNMLSEASGYFGWKLKNSEWGYGAFDLSLNFPETEDGWNATLQRVPEGSIIIVM